MIYLQRHTHPDIEPHICYGVSDIPLSPNYRTEHLPRVKSHLEALEVERIYSSPLIRCRTLAEDVFDMVKAQELIIDNRLMELNFGDWELLPWDSIHQRDEGKAWFADYLNVRPPHGESFMDLVARAESFLETTTGDEIMAVTHSGFMRAALVASGRTTAEEVFNIDIRYGDMIKL